MTFYKWSQTAAVDANVDSTINWAEGQAPSSINDSARAMMAAIAKYRDDVAGAIVTSGISSAYVLNTYQVFQSLSQMNGQVVAFTPHATNTATVTLNVDSLGAKPLRLSPGVELPSGVLIQGTPYVAIYNGGDATFYLFGVSSNPGIPLGSSIDYWGASAPSSSFALAYGQAISRATYATLFSLLSTTYGSGDGSTTFNLPDLRGRTIAGKDDMGGTAASRLTSAYFGASAASLGAVGGSQSHALTLGELPTGIVSSGSNSISVSSSVGGIPFGTTGRNVQDYISGGVAGGFNQTPPTTGTIASTGTNSISVTSNNTSGNAHAIIPPTIVANKLIRII